MVFLIISGAALSRGAGRNVRHAYKFLSRNYEPGDQIFIFGFSRGSYTARSLVGYISAVGLLRLGDFTAANNSGLGITIEPIPWTAFRKP